MIYLWLLLICIYAILLVYFRFVWRAVEVNRISHQLRYVTVVVIFRNEQINLASLINSLAKIRYPYKLLNFIFVNDHSEDASLAVLSKALEVFPFQTKQIDLPANLTGKKAALQQAVLASEAELILTTDADCLVAPDWVMSMQAFFDEPAVKMITGKVRFKTNNFLHKLLQIELSAIMGVTGVSIKLGAPGMANAANMCFNRLAFLATNPYRNNRHISTGDDVFLLAAIVAKYGAKSIAFAAYSLVITNAPESFVQFVHQRWRWASKWNIGKSFKDKLPAIFVGLFHVIYLIGLVFLLWNGLYWWGIGGFLLKAMAEYYYIQGVDAISYKRPKLYTFLMLQLFYSIYVIFFGITANFVRYNWKGRAYGRFNNKGV